eukprot:XP_003728215.2 PREDICTED: endochitinase A [Strongylocentrotus purpuratus]
MNETNTLYYYRDEDVITYRCSDGYEGPQNRTSSDDGTSTCIDGSWDPPGIPTCMDIDECSDSPCLNNGNCTDLINGYQCQCADGFNGTNCGNNIDDCASHECENGATCVDDIASYECQCPDGFNGIYCENVMTTAEMMTVTTVELPTSMETTTIADQSTIATTTIKASSTEGLPTSLPNSTPPLTTRMTPTDSSTTSAVSPGLTTVTPDATSITSGLTTVATDSTTVIPAIPTETATPTVPESTTNSDSTTSSNPTSLLPETTETVSVRSTSPADPTEPSPTESQETTASQKTSPRTPERTEKPPTTPLPCGGECRATQVCNAENNCECRPDYYEDEDDTKNPCKEPESIDVTIKITEVNDSSAEYNVKLGNSSSPEFKKLESDVCKPFEEIYKNDTEYKGCRVLEFRNGSIIVNYVLTFAENSTQSASTVNATVQEELQNPNGSFTGDYEFDDSSLVVAPLNECTKKIDTCVPDNATCIDQGADGYTCECSEGFYDVGGPNSLPGRECKKTTEPQPTEPQPTEPQPTDPQTTKEQEESGLEPWKVVVGVTVPIISILTITIVGLTCWQYRRLDKTSPKSVTTKMRTFPYEDDTRGSSDRRASRPESMMIMNNDGTVQEVVLPWRNIPAEEEFIFAPDNNGKGRTQMLPMVDYPSDYDGSASYGNDPLGNIVGSYDNYTYQHQDMTNSTEIDSKYF